jgi:hypothetical protein
MVTYSVLVGSVVYSGDITVLVTDVNNNTVYSGSNQTYSTMILESAFPISITVTPADLQFYQVYTQTNITNADNLLIVLQPVMNVVMYTITQDNELYVGTLSVVITDVTNATVYSGPLATWNSMWPAVQFPLSITVTPSPIY